MWREEGRWEGKWDSGKDNGISPIKASHATDAQCACAYPIYW